MLLAVLSGFIISIFAPFLNRISRRAASVVLPAFPLILFIYFSFFISSVSDGETLIFSYPWAPGLGINMSFYVDGLSLLFALLVSGIGVLVVMYSGSYLKERHDLGLFYSYLLAFMSSMLGLVLSDNLITLFVFWELTGLSSYFLIGFEHERETARKAALQALLVTVVGGLALLAGMLLLGMVAGSFSLFELLNSTGDIRSHPLYIPMLVLISLGAFTKSAQFPFHFWLPNAMEAPAPVSTYLHSATMVKAGIYLLARFSPIMGNTIAWQTILLTAGAFTMLLGGALAIKQTDLKRILAYSTISVLGALVLLLGIGTKAAAEAAMTYLIVHAIYKGALFLIAGTVDHETGIRDVRKLSGLRNLMPVTAFAAVLSALSMAGLPPMFGFVGKELIYGAAVDAPMAASTLTGVTILTSVFMFVIAGMVGLAPFFGSRMDESDSIHEAPAAMWFGPVLLASLGLLIGLFPNILGKMIVSPAVACVLGRAVSVKLSLIHGLSLQLVLSLITFVVGIAAYLGRKPLALAISKLDFGAVLGAERSYYLALDCMNFVARAQTRLLQSGHLHFYLLIVVFTTAGLVGWSLLGQTFMILENLSDIHFYEVVVCLVILISIVAVVRARSRFAAIVALGAVGYSVALIFIIYGAPDLAITQFSIDTLTVVLLVLVLHKMPRYARYSKPLERLRDGIGALTAGGIVTLLVLATTSPRTAASRLSPYFAENSYVLAQGRNIVNVILVDFRALDTMGEITVLGVAAIGVYSLLKLNLGRDNND